jgi:hypothetical protein
MHDPQGDCYTTMETICILLEHIVQQWEERSLLECTVAQQFAITLVQMT